MANAVLFHVTSQDTKKRHQDPSLPFILIVHAEFQQILPWFGQHFKKHLRPSFKKWFYLLDSTSIKPKGNLVTCWTVIKALGQRTTRKYTVNPYTDTRTDWLLYGFWQELLSFPSLKSALKYSFYLLTQSWSFFLKYSLCHCMFLLQRAQQEGRDVLVCAIYASHSEV